jgi:glutamate formiminotransferase/formiminotetrahydrofolate cyclodeaminase
MSDAGVAALAARTAAEGAYYNVRINLPGIQDEGFRTETKRKAAALRRRACRLAEEINRFVEKEFNKR